MEIPRTEEYLDTMVELEKKNFSEYLEYSFGSPERPSLMSEDQTL
jgi:hypothetical protein